MAKFCAYCGRGLEEGAVCDCPESAAVAAATRPAAAPAADRAKEAATGYMTFLKSYVQGPADATIAMLRQLNMTVAGVAMAIYALLSGLFIYALFGKVVGMVKDAMKAYGSKIDTSVPFGAPMFYGILIAIIVLALAFLAVLCTLKMAKSAAGSKHILIAVGANSTIQSALLLLATIVLFVSLKFALIVFAFSILSWLIIGGYVLVKVFGVADSGKTLITAIVLIIVAFYFSLYTAVNLTGKAAGKIEIEGETLESAIEEIQGHLKDFDLDDFFYMF